MRLLLGDCRESLQFCVGDQEVQTCITSPPYFGLRDYGHSGQIGLEPTPAEYVEQMVAVFREVRRVLRDDGTLWLNLGDSYGRGTRTENPSDSTRGTGFHAVITKDAGYGAPVLAQALPNKQLIGIPWRVAFALQADGWYLRQDIVWHKPNPMPESVRDRCTKAHEYLFLLTKSERYYWNLESMQEPCLSGASDIRKMKEQLPRIGGKHKVLVDPMSMASAATNIGRKRSVGNGETRNRRSVWVIATQPFKGAHFATFPPALVEPCLLAGSRPGDTVLDPFMGSGTVGAVAKQYGRGFVGCELNPDYLELAKARIAAAAARGTE